jgi:hypothetical protein
MILPVPFFHWEPVIRSVTCYQAMCDRCGKAAVRGDYTAWVSAEQAEDAAVAGEWVKLDDGPDAGKLLCDDCWTWSDDEQHVVARPVV